MGFFRYEYLNGLLFPSPRDLSSPGIELLSPALLADSFTTEPPGKPQVITKVCVFILNLRVHAAFSILVSTNPRLSLTPHKFS